MLGAHTHPPAMEMDVDQLRALEAEFNQKANRLAEIHDLLRASTTEPVPVQKRYFFYSRVIEVTMDADELEQENIEPDDICAKFIKNKIDVAISDDTPFSLSQYGGYCSEIAGSL